MWMPTTWPWPATAWNLARRAARPRAWSRAWAHQGARWLRAVLAVGVVFWVVAAHLYLANEAVVLWEDIRTLQYESWQLWWDITTWHTDLAARDSAAALRAALEAQGLQWPAPQEVLYVPVALPPGARHSMPTDIPGVWSPPDAPQAALPAEYTMSLSQWWTVEGRTWVERWLGLPADFAATGTPAEAVP